MAATAKESKSTRWEGETSVEVKGVSEEQVWCILEDFCNVHKWIPIDTCHQVDGISGQPGLIRYCAATVTDDADPQKTVIKWAKEKVVVMDPIQRCLIYEVVESNMGFKSYVATIRVLPIAISGGCKIQWSFACDPVEGWSFDGLYSYVKFVLQFMANKMMDQLACSQNQEKEKSQ